jgi:methylmalonyl-CoA mutase, N-terminal domain
MDMAVAEKQYTTISGVPIEPLYGPEQLSDLSAPGEFPYTRGIHETMYRGRLWTMRQFSGFATPEETNRRYHYLLQQGQTGLSVAFDLPTLMGYDADHALAEGEVGKCGASISSLEDMEILFRGIPLGDVTVSMTINSPAAVLWAMYLAVAEQQGVDWTAVSGTLQNDILKEYIAQKEYIFPPRPSMRLVTDTIEFGRGTRRGSILFRSADTTFARLVRPRCRSWRLRCGTAWNTWSGRWSAACRWTNSRRG